MKDRNLIASVALFSELYNSETYKNIPEIIAEFIRAAVIFENIYSFNSTELKDLLNKIYGFDIPESVIRTTLHNKFKDEIRKENNYFHFNENTIKRKLNFNTDFEEISKNQNQIIEDICNYIQKKRKIKLEPLDKAEVLENIFQFLMDNGYSDKYSDLISGYILTKQHDNNFRELLNSIKEGLILYQGINFTADINQLGSWNNELTIYLATEHLFNALGYNGILFKEIFEDFRKLVIEINTSHKNTNSKRKKIELKYLEETKNEIDNFFQTAESIKKGKKTLDPSKLAMETILKKSNTLSDIKTLRIQFDIELKKLGINYQDFNYSIEKKAKYNIVDQNIINELKKISEEKGKYFNEDNCHYYFNLFTKINTFRNGENNNRFEKCGHLYLTETAFVKYLAHNNLVKFRDNDTPFAKDIDFVTTQFWFTLKKGFSNKQSLPKSFDVVTKAKIILSSHLTKGITKNYEILLAEKKSGKLTDEEAIARSYSLREKPNTPEEITIENLDDTLEFIQNEDYLENFYREKVRKEQLLETTQKEKEELEIALKAYKDKEIEELEQSKLREFNRRKENFIFDSWKTHKNTNNKDLFLLLMITILTFILITVPFFIGLSKDLKDWLLEFKSLQLMAISAYLIFATIDILGSRYLYKKDKISNGWLWFKNLFSYSTYKNKIIEQYRDEYTE